MVGLGGLEPPTSRLSSARSNQLSYKPESYTGFKRQYSALARRGSCRAPAERQPQRGGTARERVSCGRKRNVGGSPCIVGTVVKLTGLQPLF